MAEDSEQSADSSSVVDNVSEERTSVLRGAGAAPGENSPDAAPSGTQSWKTSTLVQIVAAVIAVTGSYAGAQIAYQGSQEAVVKQIEADRKKSEREERSGIYLDFLEASNIYASRIGGVYGLCNVTPERGDYSQVQPVMLCVIRSPDFEAIRTPLHASRNMLYIYGSADANRAADEIMQKLPASEMPFPRNVDFDSFNIDDFRDRYKGLRKIACVELPPNPRTDC